jgi:hypothetical protein
MGDILNPNKEKVKPLFYINYYEYPKEDPPSLHHARSSYNLDINHIAAEEKKEGEEVEEAKVVEEPAQNPNKPRGVYTLFHKRHHVCSSKPNMALIDDEEENE